MSNRIQVTVWNEYRHEPHNEFIGNLYPNGIHGAIAEGVAEHLEAEIISFIEFEAYLNVVLVFNAAKISPSVTFSLS